MRDGLITLLTLMAFGLAGCDEPMSPFEATTHDARTPVGANAEVDTVVALYASALDSSPFLTEAEAPIDDSIKRLFKKELKGFMRLKSESDFNSRNPDKLLVLAGSVYRDAAKAANIELSDEQITNLSLIAPIYGNDIDIESSLSEGIRGDIGNLDVVMATINSRVTRRTAEKMLSALVKATDGQYTEAETLEAFARNVQSPDGMAAVVNYISSLDLPDEQISALASAFQASPSFSQEAHGDLVDELRGNGSIPTSVAGSTLDGLAGILAGIASAVANSTSTATSSTTTSSTTTATPPQLAIVSSSINLVAGVAMTAEDPANGTFVAPSGATCSISPALPAGLSLATDTCIISGTPTTVSTSATYTVTLTSGSLTATDSFTLVVAANNPTFDHGTTNLNLPKDTAMTAVDLTSGSYSVGTGSVTLTSWAVSPALPTGLSLSAAGVLSGTPTAVTASASYTFTITNSAGGTATDSITIVVADDFADDSAANFASGTMVGTEYASGKLILDVDTDCDGNMGEGETAATNCFFLDSSWTPKHSSLVAYYKFDGNYNDTITASSLTTSGVSIDTTTPKVGSGALDLTAASFSAQVPATAAGFDVEAGDFSMTMWLNVQVPTGGDAKIVSYKPVSSGTETALNYNDQGSAADLNMYDGGGNSGTGRRFPLNKWVFFSAVKTSSVMNIYINGVLFESWASTTDYSDQFDNGDPLWLGSSQSGGTAEGAYMKGLMDEFAFWNTALTESDIATIYMRQKGAQAGTFTSRVFDAGAADDWPSVSWNSSLPFHKKMLGDLDSDNDATDEDEIATAYSDLVGVAGATSTASIDLQTDLIAYYSMDGTVGAIADSSTVSDDAGAYDMTSYGNGVSRAPGLFNQALRVDGSDDYLQRGDYLGSPTTFTMSAWYNGTTTGSNSTVLWIGSAGFGVYPNDVEALYHNGGTSTTWSPGSTETRGAGWTHVVVVVNPGAHKLYLNGVEIANDTDASAINYRYNNTTIGARKGSGAIDRHFTGLIDEVAFWSRALHVDEVTQLYRRGANRNMVQFRQCASSDCSGTSWQGPDGTISSWFSDNSNATVSAPSLTFSNFGSYTANSRRYFQYRVFQESDSTSSSPDIKDLTVTP